MKLIFFLIINFLFIVLENQIIYHIKIIKKKNIMTYIIAYITSLIYWSYYIYTTQGGWKEWVMLTKFLKLLQVIF